ncbi:hypothetical protein GII32_10780 [Gordonia amarae]|uniref:hypothetical protein n=1 Tax=Gordonia amarae TaxID=36821 RepID=UPI001AF9E83F|nr:hypothetical protein [Gordonia amarae]QHN30802.1 hypothetical protein GII32_10780 [Gordonia amarae]
MSTALITDPWIERQVRAGRLAPGARGMTREQAATQFNEANALTPSDLDYLYTPTHAQVIATELLALVGIDVDPAARIMLTDGTAGARCRAYLINVGQAQAACEEHRLVTGEALSADALIEALPWA